MGLNFQKKQQFDINQETIGIAFMEFIEWYNNSHKKQDHRYASTTYKPKNNIHSPFLQLEVPDFGNYGLIEFQSFYNSDIDWLRYIIHYKVYEHDGNEVESGDIKLGNYSSPDKLGQKLIETYLNLEKKYISINEGLNLPKKKNITHEKALEQLTHFMNTIDESEVSIDKFDDKIWITLNNVGRGDFIDITVSWEFKDPGNIHILVERYDPDTDEYEDLLEKDSPIKDPNTLGDYLVKIVSDLIVKVYNGETLYEGLNFQKKKNITYEKALEQLQFFIDNIDEREVSINVFENEEIWVIINNVGRGDFVDVTVSWKYKDPGNIHIVIETYLIETEDYEIKYEDDISIIDPENLGGQLVDIVSDLIVKVYNGEPLHEGLNLPKKETFDQVELTNTMGDQKTKRYARVGYRVGWIDDGRFRYGIVTQLYRISDSDIIAVILGDDMDNKIEIPVNQLLAGVSF